ALGEVAGLAGMAADHRIGADDDDQPALWMLAVHHGVAPPVRASDRDGGRTERPQGDGSGPSSRCRTPPLWTSAARRWVDSSGRPFNVPASTNSTGGVVTAPSPP